MSDPVNPKHYRGDIVWQATKGLHPDGFNASKYLIRSTGINPEENKHPTAAGRLEDLNKAQWYLNKAIERTRAEAEQEAKAEWEATQQIEAQQNVVDILEDFKDLPGEDEETLEDISSSVRTFTFTAVPTARPDDWN